MNWQIPARHNRKLRDLARLVSDDQELQQLYVCANINAVDRSGMSDHGEVHVRIVSHAALRLLRLLVSAGIEPDAVKHHGLSVEDSEIIAFLGACLHDVGIAMHREDHERLSAIIAYPKARELLSMFYAEPELTVVVAEVLHTIVAHRWDARCLTLEAGVVKVADALDMTEGRSRIPFEAGEVNIHSVSALAVKEVKIERGVERPIRIEIGLSNSAGIFQVDELLKRKLKHSTLAPYTEVVAGIERDSEKRLIEVYRL